MAKPLALPPPELTELDAYTESINLNVYADPGAGKTVLAGTGGEKMLIIATEPGTISARRMGSKAKTVRVRDYKQFATVLNALKRTGEYGGFKPEWLAVDTLTELQPMIMVDIVADPPDGKPRMPDTPQIQDYGTVAGRFRRVVKALNDLPINVLYTTHAMRTEDEEGEPLIMPDLNGKWGTNDPTTASRWFSGTVHSFGYLKVVKKEDKLIRRWGFQRSGAYLGKDRYGVLAPFVNEPNLLEIAERIRESNTPKGE